MRPLTDIEARIGQLGAAPHPEAAKRKDWQQSSRR